MKKLIEIGFSKLEPVNQIQIGAIGICFLCFYTRTDEMFLAINKKQWLNKSWNKSWKYLSYNRSYNNG